MAKAAQSLASEGQMNSVGNKGRMNLRPVNNGLSVDIDADNSDAGFCSKKTFYFLVPPKETLSELFTVIIIASLYGFFATYLAHPKTAAMALTVDQDEQRETTCTVLTIIVVLFSSYSLLS